MQDTLGFGDVSAPGFAVSTNAFLIRHDQVFPFDPAALRWAITVESMALAVAITSPASGLLTNGTSVIVTGTFGPGVSNVVVNGVVAGLSGSNFTATVPLLEGRNPITAVGTNAFGGAGTAGILITRDTTPPLLNIEAPGNGVTLATRQITVAGMINDVVPGTVNPEQASVMINGLPAMVLNRSYAINDLLLSPGSNVIAVVARDRAGNESRRAIGVTVQDTAAQKRLVRLAGDMQSGMIKTILAQPLIVELVDANGIIQTNQPVTFNVCRNDGLLVFPPEQSRTFTVFTDDRGQAGIQFQLGTRTGVGNNQVEVTSPGVAGQLIFCANATGGPPIRISALLPETQVGATGKPLPQPWTTYVTDDGGNPVANAPVTFMVFQGDGGTINGSMMVTTNTDTDGRASVLHTLGPQEGINNNVVVAMIAGMTNSAATFTASARAAQSAANTRVVGLILDNANRPMSNILCQIAGTALQTVSDAQGQFTISNAPVGECHLFVDARNRGYPGTWHALEFLLHNVAGRDNSMDRPIYMLPLDDAGSAIAGGDQDVTLQLKDIPGATLTVYAHSMRDPNGVSITGRVMWTQVNLERVPMAPPLGSQFMLAWTVMIPGLHFDPPARICIPNMGAPPGEIVEIFSFDHDLLQFVSVGTATVTADGSQMCSDPGFGVTKSGWGGCVPPPPPNTCGDGCEDGDVCNGVKACVNGRCVQVSPPLNCMNTNPCVAVRCDPALGCLEDRGDFNPDFWNDHGKSPCDPLDPNDRKSTQCNNNCYAYANNYPTGTFAQPGRGSGNPYSSINCAEVTAGSVSDGLMPTTADAPVPPGCRKVALVVRPPSDPRPDYHWYRQDNDGTWSHKPGETEATNRDASGNPITNPEMANTGRYTIFCGYFLVCCHGNIQ